MAAGGAAADTVSQFLKEVDVTAKADAVWTSAQQIERLTKPGSSYRNLNPFEVLQLDEDADEKTIKKQTRKLQFLCHPDRNRDNAELAKKAFEEIGAAKKALDDEDKMSFVMKVLDEAKEKTEHEVKEKKTAAKGRSIEEDDPLQRKALYKKNAVILFAEYAHRKKKLLEDQAEEKRRNEQAKEEARAKRKREDEEAKQWNAGRDKRINTWRDFEKGKKKKKSKKSAAFFKPPKLKTEQRT